MEPVDSPEELPETEEVTIFLYKWRAKNSSHPFIHINEVSYYITNPMISENKDPDDFKQRFKVSNELKEIQQEIVVTTPSPGGKANGMTSNNDNRECNAKSEVNNGQVATMNNSFGIPYCPGLFKQWLLETSFIEYLPNSVQEISRASLQNTFDDFMKEEVENYLVPRADRRGKWERITLTRGIAYRDIIGKLSKPKGKKKITAIENKKNVEKVEETPEEEPDTPRASIKNTHCVVIKTKKGEQHLPIRANDRGKRGPNLKEESESKETIRGLPKPIKRAKTTGKNVQKVAGQVETLSRDNQDTTRTSPNVTPNVHMENKEENYTTARENRCDQHHSKKEQHAYAGNQHRSQDVERRKLGEEEQISDGNGILFRDEERHVDGEEKENANVSNDRGTPQQQTTQRKGITYDVCRLIQFFCLIIAVVYVPTVCASSQVYCERYQTVTLGEKGIVQCNIPSSFHAVYWFDNEASGTLPVTWYNQQLHEKGGPGLKRKTYDISYDGSLLIPHVTVEHERIYMVIIYQDPIYFVKNRIELTVVASPETGLLSVDCGDCNNDFYHNVRDSQTLSCIFDAARPQVHLEWIERFAKGETLVELQQFSVTRNRDGTFDSSVSLPVTTDGSKLIGLFVCKAKWSSQGWSHEKSILLDFSSRETFSTLRSVPVYLEIHRRAEISCGDSGSIYRVWKRISSRDEPEVIALQFGGLRHTITNLPNVEISGKGALIFFSSTIQHEGTYACVYSDGVQEGIRLNFIQILVPPKPRYIQIKGCKGITQTCRLREVNTQRLTCAVNGLYPNVSLKWIPQDENYITIYNQRHVSKFRSGLWNVLLSVDYSISENVLCEKDIRIKCELQGSISKIMKSEETVYLTPRYCKRTEGKQTFWIAFCISILSVVMITVALICVAFRCRKNSMNSGKCNRREKSDINVGPAFV